MKRFIAVLLMLALLFTTSRLAAQEVNANTSNVVPSASVPVSATQMLPVHKGTVVPFDGTLMNPSAVATLIAQINAAKQQSVLDVNKAVELEQARSTLDKAQLAAGLKFTQDVSAAQIQMRDDRIKELVAAQKPDDRQWWVAGGVFGGILVTLASAFALSLAHK